jgi:hypothetical protein
MRMLVLRQRTEDDMSKDRKHVQHSFCLRINTRNVLVFCAILVTTGILIAAQKVPQTSTCAEAERNLIAPKDTQFFVSFTVTMPYTVVQFDTEKYDKYKAAVASVAGNTTANIDIVSVMAAKRWRITRILTQILCAAGSVNVKTKIRAIDGAGVTVLTEALGRGNTLKSNINIAIQAQGLSPCTDVSDPKPSTGTTIQLQSLEPQWREVHGYWQVSLSSFFTHFYMEGGETQSTADF